MTTQIRGVVEGLGGNVTKSEYWGVKTLTFRMRKNRKAHFTLLNLDAPPPAVAEIERQERINEDVLRFMTVRVDELEEGPSAMMRKVDRDRERDRDDRGGGGFRDRDRGGFRDRDRGGFGDRDRGGFGDRERGERGSFRDRDRDSRPPRDEAPASTGNGSGE